MLSVSVSLRMLVTTFGWKEENTFQHLSFQNGANFLGVNFSLHSKTNARVSFFCYEQQGSIISERRTQALSVYHGKNSFSPTVFPIEIQYPFSSVYSFWHPTPSPQTLANFQSFCSVVRLFPRQSSNCKLFPVNVTALFNNGLTRGARLAPLSLIGTRRNNVASIY